jgi:hypothetical protein
LQKWYALSVPERQEKTGALYAPPATNIKANGKNMFSTIGFWTLFWAELLTTFWTSLGGPIDYHMPYPSIFSYLGEHVIVWLAFVFIAHLTFSQAKKSPFSVV